MQNPKINITLQYSTTTTTPIDNRTHSQPNYTNSKNHLSINKKGLINVIRSRRSSKSRSK